MKGTKDTLINYAEVLESSIIDGKGLRVVAFLQGCPRSCVGCHNPQLQPDEGGIEIADQDFASMLLKKITPLHQGITFSGGEPLIQHEALFNVIYIIKQNRPDLDIWVYTGFTFEEVKDLQVLPMIDILVDGPFVMEQRDLTLPFRGSRNQRIIDIKESFAKGAVVELAI